ncbi:MAG: glutamate--tRNA ligase family protein, partial [Bacteroidales bacterium]|nr:glutamate--tRNA ligase family protein [Bacteroidales bacterium]
TYTVMSKRKMLQLVKDGFVGGWDDPRMPTLCGLRRRGYTPDSIRNFVDRIGYTKFDGVIDQGLLEFAVREHLNKIAPRVSAVLNPVKLVITNYPQGQVEWNEAVNNPEDASAGSRKIPFARDIFVERDDFMEEAPKKFYRLTPGQEVRLKNAYIVQCTGCKKDAEGKVEEIYCTYDPLTKEGGPESNRKVKATLHYVTVQHSLPAEVRLYDRLLTVENPAEDKERDFMEMLNPDSLKILKDCRVEASLQDARPLDHFQFLRMGYFNLDPDSGPGNLIFNRTVGLKDNWGKIAGKMK